MADATNVLHEFANILGEQALAVNGVPGHFFRKTVEAKCKWLKNEITSCELQMIRWAATKDNQVNEYERLMVYCITSELTKETALIMSMTAVTIGRERQNQLLTDMILELAPPGHKE
jgi:hypothetical protein